MTRARAWPPHRLPSRRVAPLRARVRGETGSCATVGNMFDTTAHAQSLMEAAREHAEGAFRILLTDTASKVELRTAALHAGAATEFLAKSRVWQVSALLVLLLDKPEKRKAFASKHGLLDDEDLDQIHTVQASEVVDLAAAVARVGKESLRADQVLSARNQAAHMVIAPANPRQLADDLTQVIRSLLPATHTIDLEEFPDREPFLSDCDLGRSVSDRHGLAYEEVRSLITAAKERFASIQKTQSKKESTEGLDRAMKEKADEHIRRMAAKSHLITGLVDCPACSHRASAWFEAEKVLLDDDGRYALDYQQVLSCGACQLEFNARQMSAWMEREQPVLTDYPEGHPSYSDWEDAEADRQGARALEAADGLSDLTTDREVHS